jgi:outer membrane murein-binding lipoprotein Lpp
MQILRLEEKLHVLHNSDVNHLRRQQKTLKQHITALVDEARAAQAAANRLDGVNTASPDNVSKEVCHSPYRSPARG